MNYWPSYVFVGMDVALQNANLISKLAAELMAHDGFIISYFGLKINYKPEDKGDGSLLL